MDVFSWFPAAAAAAALQSPHPQPSPIPPDLYRGEPIVVTAVASRVTESLDATPATVTVIDRRDLDRELARDLRDALRYEPGVSIENAPARFGLGNISIRGLDGNRVEMREDGIRLPDAYKVGSFSNANRNPFDLALLSRIDILRGPGSALYGSDALAGVVAMTTLDPHDVLRAQERGGGFAGAGYDSAERAVHGDAVVAARAGPTELFLGVSAARGHEADNQGSADTVGTTRTVPNPQDASAGSVLAKAVLPVKAGRWRATYERYERHVQTDVLSLNPQSPKTVSLAADDHASRTRASLDGEIYDAGFVDMLTLIAYAQRSETSQGTDEVRANTTAQCLSGNGNISCRREARFTFRQDEAGASAVGESRAGGSQRWVYGAEYSHAKIDEMRDGRQTNLNTGSVSNVVGTDIFPTRDFPVSTVDRAGVFGQDEVAIGGATLIPALRYDRVAMRPRPDAAYLASNPGRTPVSVTDSAWSPKLGALVPLTGKLTLALQAAAGFRAPPYADVNVGLSNLPLGYTVVPNPDLRSETSRGFEAGLRARHAGIDWSLTAYRTDYHDLILSRAPLVCPGDPSCAPGAPITFQSRNVTRARIEGIEARLEARLDPAWTVRAGGAWSRGDDRSKGVPLNAIDPAKAVAGVAWEPRPDLGGELHGTWYARKTRIDTSAGTLFATPSAAVADLTAHLGITSRATLYAGVFNLFDRKYWLWPDVRSVVNPGATIDRYTQPGRNYSVQVKVRF
jgi:hemoglobin/transferrin/lactoferrin receptor protein